MATLREFLVDNGFDFENGRIIVFMSEDGSSPGWCNTENPSCFKYTPSIKEPGKIKSILDKVFDDGYGCPECPRFIAEDNEKIYFPAQYDGSTWVEFVYKDIKKYLNIENETPYPGG